MTVEERGPDTQRSAGVAGVQAAIKALASTKRMAFSRPGPMAILASAYGQEFDLVAPSPVKQVEPTIAVVDIRGPLVHHDEPSMWGCFDSYECIEARVGEALSSTASTVILRIDSPGGEAAGVTETSRRLAVRAAASGKKLIAYVNEQCASAAYALACACGEIYLPQSGMVGAIGVIERLVDLTKADAMQGVEVKFIVTGIRKADAHPHAPVTPEVVAAVQSRVDALGSQFFEIVSAARGISPEAAKAYQAAIFQGQEAVTAKLANGVCSFEELIAKLSTVQSASSVGAPAAMASAPMAQKAMMTMALNKQAKSMLEHLAGQGATDEVKAAAKLLLAAFPEKDDKKDDKDPAPDSEPGDGEEDEEEKKAKAAKDEEEKSRALAAIAAQASATPAAPVGVPVGHGETFLPHASAGTSIPADVIANLEVRLQAFERRDAAQAEANQRAMMLSDRQMSDETRKWLSDPSTSLKEVAAVCKVLPKAMAQNPAAAAMARPTLAEGQGDGTVRETTLDHATAERLHSAMGIYAQENGKIRAGGVDRNTDKFDLVFPTMMSREDARKLYDETQKKLAATGAAVQRMSPAGKEGA